jgi:hypothetical protein
MVITHKVALYKLTQYLEGKGWRQVRNHVLPVVKWPTPDGAYRHKLTSYTLVAEVKPSIAGRQEIQKGIGQAIFWLPFKNIRAILVIPDEETQWVEPIFRELNERSGLLVYDKNMNFHPIKDVWSELNEEELEGENLSWLEEGTKITIPIASIPKRTFADVRRTLGWRMFKDDFIRKVEEVRKKYPYKDPDWVFLTARCLLQSKRR